MTGLCVSNLQLRSNLLTEGYQQEMRRITPYEVKDIWRRNPMVKDGLTLKQQNEWIAGLFDGDTSVSMSERDRCRAWLEQLAERVEDVLAALELRADVERTFEALCVAESLAAPVLDSTYATKARSWARRARAILGRSEFRLTPQMINDRLTEVLGESTWHPLSGPLAGPPVIAETASVTDGE
jgi:hypothetical protein